MKDCEVIRYLNKRLKYHRERKDNATTFSKIWYYHEGIIDELELFADRFWLRLGDPDCQ